MLKIKKLLFADIPKQIRVYPIIKFLCSLSGGLILPLLVIYYRKIGFSLLQIGLISMVFELSMGLFEIPTGFVADKYGRKKSVTYSLICFSITGFIYFIAEDIKIVILAVVCRGIGYTLMSGAFEAWAFDKLKSLNQESSSRQMFVITSRLRRLGVIIGSLLGSTLGLKNIKVVWLAFIFINVISLAIVLMSMKETVINKTVCVKQSKISKAINTKLINAKYLVLSLFLIAAIYEFALSPISEYWSVYFTEDIGMSGRYLGAIIVISNLLVVVGLRPTHRLINKINNSLTSLIILHCLIIVNIIGFTISKNLSLAILFYLGYSFFVGVAEPLSRDYLNQHISSKYRATLLSLYAMAGSLGEIISGAAVGIIAELWGVRISFLTSAFAVVIIISLYKAMLNSSKKINKQTVDKLNVLS